MLRVALFSSVTILFAGALPAAAQTADPDLVRLPGNGAVKEARQGEVRERFVPGGGLLLSFDQDQDGTITVSERTAGTSAAFTDADRNGDGVLSALEQQAWAAELPTRDDSLANPVRFDPNLDRFVSAEEFAEVVESIAAAYTDGPSGSIQVAALKAPQEERRQRRVERTQTNRASQVNF